MNQFHKIRKFIKNIFINFVNLILIKFVKVQEFELEKKD